MKINIYLATQHLEVLNDAGKMLHHYPVSTAKNGAGEIKDSGCTPRGKHIIRAKIGANCPENTVFVRRRPTGEIYTPALAAQFPQRDWILTRILWLTGCESGFNRGGNCDTLRRFIYLHGTPDSAAMGVPQSHGCIRMRNRDIIDLFQQTRCGMTVNLLA